MFSFCLLGLDSEVVGLADNLKNLLCDSSFTLTPLASLSSWKVVHSGWGFEGKTTHRRRWSSAVGQVGAVLSAPIAQLFAPKASKAPENLSGGSLRSLCSHTLEPCHGMICFVLFSFCYNCKLYPIFFEI